MSWMARNSHPTHCKVYSFVTLSRFATLSTLTGMAHQNPPKPKAREDSCTVRRSLRDLRPIMPPAKGRERRERLPFTPYQTRGLHTVLC